MIVYTVFPNDETGESILEKNISKLNALLIKETLKKKDYNDHTKKKIFENIIDSVGLIS